MNATTPSISQQASRMLTALLGHAVGDALGVPVEFQRRDRLAKHPVTDMAGFGTHNQPAGTWSDDTSLTLCSAEALCDGFDLKRMGDLFVQWRDDAHWTPHGEVFDIGNTTQRAISKLARGVGPVKAGPTVEHSNGNGSLMRILPVALYLSHDDEATRRERVMQASCLTHGHVRSQLACAFYAEIVARLMRGETFTAALDATQALYRELIDDAYPAETEHFKAVLRPNMADLAPDRVSGSGYVMHCLHASLWCCARARTFEEAVLAAVNLGDDTDTTAAVTGGLAGLVFGDGSLPDRWIAQLARRDDMLNLYTTFAEACVARWKGRES